MAALRTQPSLVRCQRLGRKSDALFFDDGQRLRLPSFCVGLVGMALASREQSVAISRAICYVLYGGLACQRTETQDLEQFINSRGDVK